MSGKWKGWQQAKQHYHPNFKRRALWRKKRVKYTCEHCGAMQGEERLSKQGHPYRVVVVAAHVNHDPANARARLIILCSACHGRFDRSDHAIKTRRTYYRKEREAQEATGQLVGKWFEGKRERKTA